jgi:hypothetical protein
MGDLVPVIKDELNQQPIPTVWRATLASIVSAIRTGTYGSLRVSGVVRPLPSATAKRIASNIAEYGCTLLDLPEASWETSVCQWMAGYWQVLVDLFTLEEGLSDLALHLKVYESDGNFEYEILSVHVS